MIRLPQASCSAEAHGNTSENALTTGLLESLVKGMLCLADRGFYSFEAWQRASKIGTDLCWRVTDTLTLESIEDGQVLLCGVSESL